MIELLPSLAASESVTDPCQRALAALEAEGDLLQLSDRGKCEYRAKPIRHYFRTAQALVNGGEGRSYGVQFLLRHELAKGFFGWVAYTILRSERKDAASDAYRLFDFDQTHVLTALASYDLGKGFDIGVRGRYASGYPRTPVVDSYFDSRSATYQPVLGAKNSIRIPEFVELDVRLAKRFKFQSSALEIYLDVQNVSNRKNPEEIAYNADYTQRRYIEGLPILPVLGVKWEF